MIQERRFAWKALVLRAVASMLLLALLLHGSIRQTIWSARYDDSQALTANAQTATTRNWAGYIAANQGVTSIGATWTMPGVPLSRDERSSSTWIGIGGAFSSDLIQVGTAQASTANGLLYAVWYETLPSLPVVMHITARPGDDISASIRQTATDTWSIQATNLSSGQSDSRTVTYHSTLSSAEWIVETPMNLSGRIRTLANFGSVHFSNTTAAIGDQSIDLSTAIRVTMTDGLRDLVRVNPIVSGGFDAFYVVASGS